VLGCEGSGGGALPGECLARLSVAASNDDVFVATLLVGGVVVRSLPSKDITLAHGFLKEKKERAKDKIEMKRNF